MASLVLQDRRDQSSSGSESSSTVHVSYARASYFISVLAKTAIARRASRRLAQALLFVREPSLPHGSIRILAILITQKRIGETLRHDVFSQDGRSLCQLCYLSFPFQLI